MVFTPTTRASLLLRLRDPQDHVAWTEFVGLYQAVCYRIFRKHGLQDADAHEVMQELFLIVSRHIDQWDLDRERGSFRGWLHRVSRNLVINWLKHPQRRAIPAGGDEQQIMFQSIIDPSSAESQEFDYELRRTIFHEASEQVRHDVSAATWNAFWETSILGASPNEVATKLGMNVGAVRVAKCRVLAKLRDCVAKLENSK